MLMLPTVSVVIPCYNAAPFLRETLESALNQTHPPLEIIVIDDGSTDDSAAIAESYGPPVRVIRQANQGESVARNRGMAEARGSHLFFLDADDVIRPSAFERLLEATGGREDVVGLMGCGHFRANPENLYEVHPNTFTAFFPTVLLHNPGPPHCWLFPTGLSRAARGYDVTLNRSEDWHFVAKLALAGAGLASTAYIGACYRRHPQSQVAKASRKEVSLGHVRVLETLLQGIVADEQLCKEHGEAAFWSGLTILKQSRQLGASPSDRQELAEAIQALARCGPASLRRTKTARMVRMVGVEWTEGVRNIFSVPASSPAGDS